MEGLTFSGQILVFYAVLWLRRRINNVILTALVFLVLSWTQTNYQDSKIMVPFILSRYGLLAYKPSKNFCVDWKYRKGKKNVLFVTWMVGLHILSRIMQT